MGKALIKELETAGAKAGYDMHAKQILANRYVLAWIMKETVEEFAEASIDQIVCSCIGEKVEISREPVLPGEKSEELSGNQQNSEKLIGDCTESVIPGEGSFSFDIRFHAYAPEEKGSRKILFDLEAQKNYYPGYEIVTRGIFYGARMLSAQAYTEFVPSKYNDIKKVYSIWVCMNAPGYVGSAVSRFEMMKRDLKAGIRDKRFSYDKLSVIQISLNEKAADKSRSVTRLLNVIFSETMPVEEKKKILTEEYDLIPKAFEGEELNEMCNLGEGIYERGMEKGMEKGIEEGLERGIEKGKAEQMISSVESIMKNLPVSLEKACSIIGITVKQYEKARALM